MGCYPPLAKFVSKALRKFNGRERWKKERLDYAMAYPPGLPMETHYMQPVARTVTFAKNNNVYVIPPQQPPQSPPPQQQQEQSTPEPQQQQTTPPPQPEPDHHDDTPPEQTPPEPQPAPAQEKNAEDAPPPAAEPNPKPPKGPKRGKNKKGRVRFGPEPPPPQEEQQPQQDEHAPDSGDAPPGHEGQHGDGRRGGPAPAQMPAYLFRYTPSPLPRWEATPRRHEYFSGEYRSYYPTPVREGIYRIATDANRLTTIFSEENPNACTIV
ncbi:hypothetical protein EJB05_19731 [Eragrostis curvula]|uniref:Uncharacterized protein n=1 Tax=Eragrostis curvula TaxID=38414 RepID=A0A5J9UWG7_9POAL|nr:hypothetical protein EJB05_19731 [Eragrostis curvula]